MNEEWAKWNIGMRALMDGQNLKLECSFVQTQAVG